MSKNDGPRKSNATIRPSPQSKGAYGGWQFARDFFTGIFSLLNTGKIFPVSGLLILLIMGIVVWRLPESELAGVANNFLSTISSSNGFLVAVLVASNAAWAWLIRQQRKIYQNEIDRLSDIRNQLLQGKDKLVPLTEHNSSNGIHPESYILPDTPPKQNRE